MAIGRLTSQHQEVFDSYGDYEPSSELPLSTQSWSEDDHFVPSIDYDGYGPVPPSSLSHIESYGIIDECYYSAEGQAQSASGSQSDNAMVLAARPVSLQLPLTDPIASWKRRMCL